MKTVAVVLNYKREADTIECVRSLKAVAPDVEVIIVDNASTAESAAALERDGTLIRSPKNLGYAGGNNLGIKAALDRGAEHVLVLNNDLTLEPGAVDALHRALAVHPDWGLAGPLSLLPGPGDIVDFFAGTVILDHAALEVPGRDEPRGNRFASPQEADYITGSALLIRRAVLGSIGMFDERYFLMWEDVDFCLRARKAGFKCGATPAAVVRHARSASFGGEASPLHRYFFVRNPYLILRTHLKPPRRWLAEARATRRYLRWSRTGDPRVRTAIRLGMQHGLRGRFGPPPPELLDS